MGDECVPASNRKQLDLISVCTVMYCVIIIIIIKVKEQAPDPPIIPYFHSALLLRKSTKKLNKVSLASARGAFTQNVHDVSSSWRCEL